MILLAPNNRAWCRTFNFGTGPSERGPRFGGLKPTGLDVRLAEAAEYIMTFQIAEQPDLFASVFRNCTFDEFIESMNDGFQTDGRILVVPHADDLPRSSSTLNASSVTPHPIVASLSLSRDLYRSEDGRMLPTSEHKFGGEPYCIQEPELPGAAELFASGHCQVIQVEFPGPNDGQISGDWPFMDGLFNLFWKPPFFGVPYHWYLQK